MTSKKTETVARNVADKRKPRSQSAASNKKAASAAAPKPVSKKIPRKNLIAGKHPAPQKSSTKAGAESSELTFPVVGVGASAGGLEAFSALLRNLDPVAGMAYVLVQHLDPRRTSALVELLSRETVMPVAEAKDGMAVVPNRVYIIPPSANLAILHGVLHLMPLIQDQGLHLSIDYFFRSLAEDQGSNAIGVILSGTASDGVLGLKAIKAEGGITFSQDEKSAKYEGMPRSAMAAGCVDFVLPPDRIALELRGVARHPYVAHARGGELGESLPLGEEDMSKIFILLRSYSGVDFAYYKQATIRRRIKRRMLLHKMERLSDYVRYLQDSQSEVSALYHDMLINVTSFFRDPEVLSCRT